MALYLGKKVIATKTPLPEEIGTGATTVRMYRSTSEEGSELEYFDIYRISQEEYDALEEAGTINDNALYLIEGGESGDGLPEPHAATHATDGSDPITPASIGAAREIGGEIVTTSTDKTLALTDAGKLILCNNSSAITITIPTNASVAFPTGTEIRILRYYGGSVTISASSEVYLYSIGSSSSDIGTSKKIANRYEVVRLKKVYQNRWILEDNTAEGVSSIKSTADAASYSFTASDIGQTVCPSYLAADIDVVYTMPKDVSNKIPLGSVIPVLFRYGKSLKIVFEGDARSAVLGDTAFVANRTYEIPQRFGMAALQKVDVGSTDDVEYWIVQGNVEVVE